MASIGSVSRSLDRIDHRWASNPTSPVSKRAVIHRASSTPSGNYANEDDWNRPAVEGNLRVLRAARDPGVERFVLTSAFGAVGCGHEPMDRPYQ
jgi:nucleoside-diphosphate-sugar epimerase